jgi:hypothetical protein
VGFCFLRFGHTIKSATCPYVCQTISAPSTYKLGDMVNLPGITSSWTRNQPEEWSFRRELPAYRQGIHPRNGIPLGNTDLTLRSKFPKNLPNGNNVRIAKLQILYTTNTIYTTSIVQLQKYYHDMMTIKPMFFFYYKCSIWTFLPFIIVDTDPILCHLFSRPNSKIWNGQFTRKKAIWYFLSNSILFAYF